MSKKDFNGIVDETFGSAAQLEKMGEENWKPKVKVIDDTVKKQKPAAKLIRKAYYLTEEQAECIRILAYQEKKDLSTVVREIIDNAFAERTDIIEEAKANLNME